MMKARSTKKPKSRKGRIGKRLVKDFSKLRDDLKSNFATRHSDLRKELMIASNQLGVVLGDKLPPCVAIALRSIRERIDRAVYLDSQKAWDENLHRLTKLPGAHSNIYDPKDDDL